MDDLLANKKIPTVRMKEVADRAGVSVATVSRVLSGKYYVAPHLQEKVIQAANELGYRKLRGMPSRLPKPTGRGKKMDHTLLENEKKLVWVYANLESSTSTNYYSPWAKQMRDGLSHGALLNNFQIVYEPLERVQDNTWVHIPQENLAGILVLPHDDAKIGDIVKGIPSSIPIVVINGYFQDERVPSIDIDHYTGSYDMTSFLLKIGHRRIMIFNLEDPAGTTENQRLEGYKQAFTQMGIPIDDSLIVREPLGEEWFNWPEILRKALTLKPTAILLPNHGRVAHAVEIIKREGFRIPEDISLVIFDDDPTLLRIDPPISAVRQPLDEMGRLAMELIMKVGTSQTPIPSHTRLQTEFVVRNSIISPNDR